MGGAHGDSFQVDRLVPPLRTHRPDSMRVGNPWVGDTAVRCAGSTLLRARGMESRDRPSSACELTVNDRRA